MKSGVQPWMGCGWKAGWLPAGPPSAVRSCGSPEPTSWALAGSERTIFASGQCCFSTRPTPDGAAGAVAGDEVVELLAGEIGDDLGRGGALVDVGVGAGLELVGEEPAVL